VLYEKHPSRLLSLRKRFAKPHCWPLPPILDAKLGLEETFRTQVIRPAVVAYRKLVENGALLLPSIFGLFAPQQPVMTLNTKAPNTYKNTSALLTRNINGEERNASVIKWDRDDCCDLMGKCLSEFNDARAPLSLNLTSAAQLYSHFRLCVGGTVRDDLDALMSSLSSEDSSVETFDQTLLDFARTYFSIDEFLIEKEYLQQAKKPRDMTVKAYKLRVKQICLHMGYLHRAPQARDGEIFNEKENKNRFFNAMPLNWQHTFRSSGNTLDASSQAEIELFMLRQESDEEFE
jgi:hypothetical protein